MNRMFQVLLLGLGAFAVTGLIVPATVSAVPGWYYVWTDFMSGHVKDMEYALQSGRTMAWYPWDGYGSYGADPPYFISILSQTEWYYGVSE